MVDNKWVMLLMKTSKQSGRKRHSFGLGHLSLGKLGAKGLFSPELSSLFALSLVLVCFFFSGCVHIPQMLMKDPLTAEEHNNLGVAYEKEGRYELAIREYERAASMDDTLLVPLVNAGNVYYKQEKYEKAEQYYLRALEIDSMNLEAANNLASVYIKLGRDYQKGLDYLTSATGALNETPAYALDTLGVLHFSLGEREKAEEIFIKACEKAEGDEGLLREIESHLGDLGREGCPDRENLPDPQI